MVGETTTPRPLGSPAIRRYPQVRILPGETKDQCSDGAARVAAFLTASTSSDGRPAGGASAAACPISPGSSPRSSAVANGSTPPAALDRPASALAEPTAAAEQPTRAAAQESPVPSSRAAAPGATPARTSSARRDRQAIKASEPSLDHDKSAEPTELDAPGEPRTSLRTLRGSALGVLSATR